MKANVTKAIRAAVLGTALLLSTTAWAGYNANVQVTIGNGFANGIKADARSSADPTQYIGCSISSTTAASSPFIACSARNSAGASVVCTSTDWKLREVVGAMPSYGYVYFTWNSAWNCTQVHITNGSETLP